MRKDILVAVDGSAASARAARYAVARWKAGYDRAIHLVHVQSPLRSGEVSALVTVVK